MESVLSLLDEAPAVTDADLRGAGYTADARKYPLSAGAMMAKCAFNGISPRQAPVAWWYAPNQWAKDYWEDRAALSPPDPELRG